MQASKKTIFIRILAFLGILVLLTGVLSVVTEKVLSGNDKLVPVRDKNYYRIQKEPENSIDVLILGDSLSYATVSPMTLWRERGYTSYACGQTGQKAWEAEEMLRTALKTQTPKVVILETNTLFADQGRRLRTAFEALAYRYVPLFRGHDVWKALVMDRNFTAEDYKGFALRTAVVPYENGAYMEETNELAGLNENSLVNLDHIKALCEDCGAELILFSAPSPSNYTYARHNALTALAEEEGLLYLDMNLCLEEMGIDWATDSLDDGDHVNLSGAEKATEYLGEYLAENMDLPDHRGEAAYASWEAESLEYEDKAADFLAKIRSK